MEIQQSFRTDGRTGDFVTQPSFSNISSLKFFICWPYSICSLTDSMLNQIGFPIGMSGTEPDCFLPGPSR